MPGLTCNACNKEFIDDADQKLHYKSEWHRYNLKRKVAGVPGVTETLFEARQSALAEEKRKVDETPMLYTCEICGKGYRSSKAHTQHLESKSHLMRASQVTTSSRGDMSRTVRPLARRAPEEPAPHQMVEKDEESEESEWEEVDSDEDMDGEASDSVAQLEVNENSNTKDMDEDDEDFEELDPSCCFMCDLDHDTLESCMVHMHKHHGFFIPDIEYLKDPKGLLTYLSLKVKRDFICLYCNERCQPFSSLEAVRKHMEAKSHCKVHYGDGSEEEEAELEEFYDYSSSYVDADGKQLVAVDDMQNNSVEIGNGGSELIITRQNGGVRSTKMLGSREYLRYYRQNPRPTAENSALTAALASRYQHMGLATLQSREHAVRLKVMKAMNRNGVEYMRSKMGMKSNVIRNLPNNVPY